MSRLHVLDNRIAIHLDASVSFKGVHTLVLGDNGFRGAGVRLSRFQFMAGRLAPADVGPREYGESYFPREQLSPGDFIGQVRN